MAVEPDRPQAKPAPTLPDVDWVSGLRMLVTGAAGAMGRGLVEEAVRQGASVVATGREPSLGAAELADAAVRIAADLADPAACSSLPGRAAEALGGLDVLINNAAVLVRRDFADLSLDELEQAWRVNLRAPVLLMQAARHYLEQSPAAAIVNVVSTAAFNGGVDRVAPYAMSKAGLVGVTKSVAKEFGPLGIRVLSLSPPSMESQMRTHLSREVNERVRTGALLGRMAEMREVTSSCCSRRAPMQAS